MAEGEDGDEDLENLWDLDFEDEFISEGSLDSVECSEEDDAGSDSSQTLRLDPDFAYCGTSWLDKEDRYRRSIQIELQRAKCYHTVAHINYRQSPTNSRSRKEFAKAYDAASCDVHRLESELEDYDTDGFLHNLARVGKILRLLSRTWSKVSDGWRSTSDPSRGGNVQKTGKRLKKSFRSVQEGCSI